ncbi:MAG TPA: hypothetical protein VIM70_22015 [Clostridium sp.]|uniref:hypothetical protein n=1 Tax=Clostridium sp. TaxID=1506 RepID=UPI002F926E9D
MSDVKTVFLKIEELRKFCEENDLVVKVKNAPNVTEAKELIKKELPTGKDVKIEVVRNYRRELKKTTLLDTKEQIEIKECKKFCEDNKLVDKVKKAINDNEAFELIKKALPEGKNFSLATVKAYRAILKNIELKIFQKFCEKNELNDKIKNANNDNEAWNLVKILPEGKDFSLDIVTAYREYLNKYIQLDELKKIDVEKNILDNIKNASNDNKALKLIKKLLPEGKDVEIDTVIAYRKFIKETYVGLAQGEKTVYSTTEKQSKEIDNLKAKNKNLNDENDSLKNQNELLKQQVKALNNQREIKNDFTSKIPSLNDIASSEDKTSVFINKDILVKATKYVDSHSLVKLENIIINGHDLNSAIVQSVLLEFILQNSLL